MAYTWSKWLQAVEYLNPADPLPTKMIADQDSPHRFSLSGIYALPFGKGQRFANSDGVLDRIVGGWQLQGVYQFQTGFPIAFGAFNITTGVTSGDIFYNGGEVAIPAGQATPAAWFNPAPFTSVLNTTSALATPLNHFRTLPFRFSNIRRDNINNVDLSLMKNTRITETMRFQIRLEAINAFNHPYYPAPGVSPGSNTLGTIVGTTANQANYARRLQIGFKFIF